MLFSFTAFANVTLPSVFSDNMVLQRNSDVVFWGWANPNEEITIMTGWNNATYTTKANNQAHWQVAVNTTGASGPFTVSVNQITLNNVLLGEVWFCSGQSNMEMTPAWGIGDGEKEMALANIPSIRFFTVPKLTSSEPQDNVAGRWEVCTPETRRNSSALAYFFARRLREKLGDVPVGIIVSAWGGTPAEPWIPADAVDSDPVVLAAANKLKSIDWGPVEKARTYNAMVHPLTRFKIAGVLWYQGESNVGSPVYDKTLGVLISSWRRAWSAELPFYYVQIAPYNYGEDHDGGAVVRDSQRKLLRQVSNTGMVVISDVSPTDDIHPKDKKSVGIRLANLALNDHYKILGTEVNGPLYHSIRIDRNKVIVRFDHSAGLYLKNKQTKQFEVAGSDGIFHPAKASIRNNEVVLASANVKNPLKVRFAWTNTAQSEMFNAAGLPASTFASE